MKKILFSGLLLPVLASAQMNYTGGPNNLTAECKAVWASGDSALMGYNKGLYRTLDGGQNWEYLTNGIPYDCDPRVIEYADGKLYVASNNASRMYTSTDFGDSFIVEAGNLALLSPTAGTSGPGVSMIGGTLVAPSIYNSSTSAWDAAVSGSMTHDIEYLAEDTIWLCSGSVTSGTTQYSHDNGQTWTAVINEPNTDIGGGVIMNALAKAIAKVGSRIIVGTNLNGFPILYTDDYGTTWTAANATGYVTSQILVVNPNLILAVIGGGIYQSTDQGVNWTYLNPAHGELAVWKNNKLLSGNYEYDNLGAGNLLKIHSVPGTASNLVPYNGLLLSAVHGNIMSYDPALGVWEVFQDTAAIGDDLNASNLFIHNGNMYTLRNSGTSYTSAFSTDNGVTFNYFDVLSLVGQSNFSYIGNVSGKDFIGSFQNPNNQPRISYSTDGGATYTNASFSNNISSGLYGAGANYCENILDAGNNVLVADFNAGYAISTDGGLNWTFTGGAWDQSYMTVSGNTIYHYNTAILSGTKTLKMSADGGSSWQNVSLTGLPNSGGSNYNGYFGVWLLNGKVNTYNAHEAPRGIYELDETTNTWSLVANSECPFPNWDGVTELSYHGGNYYASWFLGGVYSSGAVSGVENYADAHVRVYPNPSNGMFTIEGVEGQNLVIYNLYGQIVYQGKSANNGTINLEELPGGIYLLQVGNLPGTIRLVKE